MAGEKPPEHRNPDVADWYYDIPYYIKEYWTYALLVVAVGLLAFQYMRYTAAKKENAQQDAWAKLNMADSPGTIDPPAQLSDVISEVKAPNIQAMAYLKTGLFYVNYLNSGITPDGFQGVKMPAGEAAAAGVTAFNHVINDYPDQQFAVAVAHMGLGALAEARGDWSTARAEYETIVKAPASSVAAIYAPEAQYRIDHMHRWQTPIALIRDVAPTSQPALTLPDRPMGSITTRPATAPAAR